MNKKFFVSKDNLCKYALSTDSNDWKKCNLPGNHKYDSTYTIVFNKDHLSYQKYDCGCIIFDNKYYPEFKMPEAIWCDFFGDKLGAGEKMIQHIINRK